MNYLVFLALVATAVISQAAPQYADRLVWMFGWGLGQADDLASINQVLDDGAKHGINGAVFSLGLDTLCKKKPEFFERLKQVQESCDQKHIEFIPAIFSVGYGGAALAHDRNLAEGLPVKDAPLVVKGGEARLLPDATLGFKNPGFEEFTGTKFKGFNFHDEPGKISFVDTIIKHSGQASVRLENLAATPHGHGRVMQEVRVHPYRCYRLSMWVKTENLTPANSFRIQVLTGNRSLAPREFNVPGTAEWRKLTMVFNSLSFETVRVYAGTWGGKSGKFWLDDWLLEELGPLNVLQRPGTPVTIKSEDGQITYQAGKDYAPLIDPGYTPYNVNRESPPLKLLPGSRIKEDQRLKASWYHSMVVNDSQVTVCMAEPALYEFFDHETRLLAQHFKPRRVMLNMDEIRMGGTCQACEKRNMGELLGECITRQAQTIRKHLPASEIYIWSDMLDPSHNAHGDYYLVQGDFTGSWNHVPKDLIMAVWGGPPREKSLRFFAEHGFKTLASCYYDADNLNDVKKWLEVARPLSGVRGFMYTPWQKKYSLLPEFGDLVSR